MMIPKNIVAITAMDFNGAIGKDNKLLCKLKDDMKIFRQMTDGNIVVMGSKTYASIGKPLKNRINIILTRNKNYPIPKCFGCHVMHSVDEVLTYFIKQEKDMFIIGGEQIYEQFLPYCNGLVVSRIEAFFDDADAHFPEVDWDEWKTLGQAKYVPADENNEYGFTNISYSWSTD